MSNSLGSSQNPVRNINGFPEGKGTIFPFLAPKTASFTVSPADSGCIFSLGQTTGNAVGVIGLPPVADSQGCQWEFIMSSTGTNIWQMTGPTAVLCGKLACGSSTGTNLAKINAQSININTGANIGDSILVRGNGTNFFINGQTSASGPTMT